MATGFTMCRINYSGYQNLNLSDPNGVDYSFSIPSSYHSGGCYISYYWFVTITSGEGAYIYPKNTSTIAYMKEWGMQVSSKWKSDSDLPTYKIGFTLKPVSSITYSFDIVIFISDKSISDNEYVDEHWRATQGNNIARYQSINVGYSFSQGQIVRLSDFKKLTSQCESLDSSLSDNGKITAAKWNSLWKKLVYSKTLYSKIT